MEYQTNNNYSNKFYNDVVIINNKEKYYQNIIESDDIEDNNLKIKNNTKILQLKINELTDRIEFIKKNCLNYNTEQINSKLILTINNIDSIIEQINWDIINNAQLNNYKKIIKDV
jgi:hypothetical protein